MKMTDPLNRAANFIFDFAGTCPNDLVGFNHPENCADVCSNESGFEVGCWILYFKELAKDGVDEAQTEYLQSQEVEYDNPSKENKDGRTSK